MSRYKNQIILLRKKGKKYREICDILGCSMSIIAYYTTPNERDKSLIRNKRARENGYVYGTRKKAKKRNRKFVESYLLSHPCIDCGNSDIRVLEFDHVRGEKLGNISHAVQRAWSIEKLKAEIDKCEVRCCNCHRIITINRRKTKNKNFNS